MARSQKAADAAAIKAHKAAAAAALKAQKAAEREAIKAQKAAQREYEKQVRAAAKAAEPKRPRGRPRKSVTSGASGGGGYIDAPVLTPPHPPVQLAPRQQDDDIATLRARMTALEIAYADMNRRLQSIMAA
jgi:hypothetical protein